jgi:alkylation response protein AidB-like acyl-CoA dehydrogenase
MMDFSFTEDQRAIRRSVVKFAEESLNADLAERDRSGIFRRDLWSLCGKSGLTGLPVPDAYGGRGLDTVGVFNALEGLGYGCRDNGLVFSIHAHLWGCVTPVLLFGSEAQKSRHLPGLCDGRTVGAIAMAEPGAGSDAFSLTTRAESKGGDYVLNGSKTLITNAPEADLYVVFARLEPGGVSAFLVEKNNPGLAPGKRLEKMGLRSSPLGELVLRDCRVPGENLLGKGGDGPVIFTTAMEYERCGIPASHVGTMERILERCVAFAKKRKQFGRAIGEFQAVSHRIADMKIRLESARGLVYRAAWLKSRGKQAVMEASITKAHVSECYVQTCLDAIQIHGGRGYLEENELERELRDAIPSRIYSGTVEIQKAIISKWLGL